MGKRLYCLGILVASLGSPQAFAAHEVATLSNPASVLPVQQCLTTPGAIATQCAEASRSRRADFKLESASVDTHHLADWVVDSRDNYSMPFMIVDKTEAKVFVFDTEGRLLGASPALLGQAAGDDSVPGIGERKLSTIRPGERTTPAGRFVAALGHNSHGVGVLWVDYDNAISLHRVVTSNIKEKRAQRLATATSADNRISYGCINVSVKFYERVVNTVFNGTNGVVYVLPETRSVQQVFNSYEVK